jgi:PTS system beta-glucosides-specific IIC component
MGVFADPNNGMNIVHAFIGFGVSFVVSLALSLVLWRDPVAVDASVSDSAGVAAEVPSLASATLSAGEVRHLVAPMTGVVVPLSEVGDDAFSRRMLGDGVAIRPQDGRVSAPADGVVQVVSGHAVTMVSDEGFELLIHVGIDTVRLKGQFFHPHVKQGDRVRAGQILLDADLDGIRKAGFDTTTPIIVRNSARYTLRSVAEAAVETGERLLQIGAAETVPA